jgi:hypothetical protein
MQPDTERKIEKLRAQPTPIQIACDVHPWMNAKLMVFNHPYFTITDADGKFEIAKAPTGRCRLMVRNSDGTWLGGAKGREGKLVSINGTVTDEGELKFPPPK